MSRHRAMRGPARRGFAKWPFVSVGTVVLMVAGWLSWSYAGDLLERRAAARLASCMDGEATLTIAGAPAVAGVVGRAAAVWTKSRPVVLDHCIRAEVATIPPQAVLDGLTAGWDRKALGERPGAWLPESSVWVNRLTAQNARLLGSEPASIATSPVLLAMPETAAAAVREGNSFSWGDLPALVSEENAWSRYGHEKWGRFSVAIPDVSTNPASALSLQAVMADVSPQGTGPVTVEMLGSPGVTDAMGRLAAAAPMDTPATTTDALNALAEAGDLSSSPFDAVPTLEYDLYRRNVGADGNPPPMAPLIGAAVGGPTPTADFPFVAIADEQGDQVHVRAAQKFREYLQTGTQQLELAKAGLRVPSTKVRPSPAPGIRGLPTQEELTPADANTTQQISAAWTNAGGSGQVVTVLIDVSRSMLEDGGEGKNRLDWVKEALSGQIGRFGSGSLGLWEFSRDLGDGGEPYRRLVDTGPVAEQRDELEEAVDELQAQSATHLYPSLLAVYDVALDDLEDGRRNRVVVITDGPDDSQVTYEQFKRELTKRREGSPALPISVIAIGAEPNQAELTELTRITGGTFATVTDGTGIEAALGQSLG